MSYELRTFEKPWPKSNCLYDFTLVGTGESLKSSEHYRQKADNLAGDQRAFMFEGWAAYWRTVGLLWKVRDEEGLTRQ